MQERDNILYILKKTKQALFDKDTFLLNKLSNRTIHTSSIYNDSDNIAVAVIVYALSKIVAREKYSTYKEWPDFFSKCIKGVDDSIANLEIGDIEKFRAAITTIIKAIEELSGPLKGYIEEVFHRARINKASRIYEHGISMKQTADLLGISVFELAEYWALQELQMLI